jgi:mono/diheme cytochrome c family protein
MKIHAVASVLLLAGLASAAFAQQQANPPLTPTQTEGRDLFAKSCSICHLPPQYSAPTYGPRLNQTSLGGNDQVMRQVISDGTPRMPAWKHMYKPAEIDSIIAYIKTVPAPAPAPQPAAQNR